MGSRQEKPRSHDSDREMEVWGGRGRQQRSWRGCRARSQNPALWSLSFILWAQGSSKVTLTQRLLVSVSLVPGDLISNFQLKGNPEMVDFGS